MEPWETPKCDLCGRRLTEGFEVRIGICEECCEDIGCEDDPRWMSGDDPDGHISYNPPIGNYDAPDGAS